MRPTRHSLVLLLLTVALTGCEGGSEGAEGPQGVPLRVSVAASLSEAMTVAAGGWSEETGIPVILTSDATSRLVEQLDRGAPTDLLITADRRWMDEARARDLVEEPALRVAGNRLALIASDGAGPQDLLGRSEAIDRIDARGGVIALAGEEVPAGRYAREALAALGLAATEAVVTGGTVRTALEWVATGDAELGIVYETDARAEGRVRIIHLFDPALHTPIEAVGAVVAGGRTAPAADLLRYLAGPSGQRVLGALGFVVDEEFAPGEASPATTPEVQRPALGSALKLSLLVALLAVALGTLPAVAAGRLLATRSFPGRSVVSALLLAPLVIPPVVTGFLLLTVLGAGSPLGRALTEAGLRIPFTPLAAVLAACAVGLPLYAVVVRGAFHAVDPRYEELSWTLGVPPRATFRRVALPLALPGIAAGAVLAFARALGEFGATIVLAGNVEGETRTLALAVFSLLETPGASRDIWVFVGASVALSLVGLLLYERLLEGQRRRMDDGRSS